MNCISSFSFINIYCSIIFKTNSSCYTKSSYTTQHIVINKSKIICKCTCLYPNINHFIVFKNKIFCITTVQFKSIRITTTKMFPIIISNYKVSIYFAITIDCPTCRTFYFITNKFNIFKTFFCFKIY